MENLKGKKVVVMGGSSGIGLSTAKVAAAQGATVVIVSSNKERISQALTQLPTDSKGFVIDLTQEQQVAEFFATLGKFDHLVYTAGEALQLNSIENILIEDAKQFLNLRYWGAFTAVKYAAPHINKNGSIVLTSGIASQRPGAGWSLGASICAAMEGFTRAMAAELAPLRVNIVSPGVVKTNLWANMTDEDREGMYTNIGNSLPVKYVAGPDEVAQTYIYLMQQQYSTGQVVTVDGGYVLV